MALDPSAEYPGQVEIGDAGYPLGKAQNVTVEGDGTGTPFEKALVNDLLGWQQALLAAAGITPNGSPDMVGASDYLKAIYRLGRWAPGWGAVGDGATDDTAALQAALTAVAALSVGMQELHLWPGATYRHTGLTVPGNVSIIFHGATLQINHASNAALTYSSASLSDAPKQRLVGGRFTANVANTGATVRVTASIGLEVERCFFGASTNCNGKFIDTTGAVGGVIARECTFRSRASAIQVDFDTGFLELVRCKHIVPATYSVSCVKVATAETWIEAPHFDVSGHSSGSMVCIEVTGVNTVAHITNAKFYNDTDPAVSVAIKWTAAAKIIERGSTFSGNITPYSGSDVLAEGSWLDLRPHAIAATTDEAYVLPDDYRSFSLEGTFGTNPALTLPTMRFPGQEYDLQLYQASAVDLTAFSLNALGPNIDTLDGLDIKTGRMKVMWDAHMDRWYWMVIGEWSTGFERTNEVT